MGYRRATSKPSISTNTHNPRSNRGAAPSKPGIRLTVKAPSKLRQTLSHDSDDGSDRPVRNARSTRNPRKVVDPDSDEDEDEDEPDLDDDDEDGEGDEVDDGGESDENMNSESDFDAEDKSKPTSRGKPAPRPQPLTKQKVAPQSIPATTNAKASSKPFKSVEQKEMEDTIMEDEDDVDRDGDGDEGDEDEDEEDGEEDEEEEEDAEGESDDPNTQLQREYDDEMDEMNNSSNDDNDNDNDNDQDDDADGFDEDNEMSRSATPDISKLTRRQRAVYDPSGDDGGRDGLGLMSLSNDAQKRKHLTAEEHAMRKAEMARRRKNLSEKKNEEEKVSPFHILSLYSHVVKY